MRKIGSLPKEIDVNGVYYPINSDYRSILFILSMYNDTDFRQEMKAETALGMFYLSDNIPYDDLLEAYEKMLWFVDGGEEQKDNTHNVKLMDWEQDEKIIFSAINKVTRCEIREKEYMHWWTFLGYMREIEEGTFTTIVSIRAKRSKGKKLDKTEQEFYNNNKNAIVLKMKKTKEETAYLDEIRDKFGYERR